MGGDFGPGVVVPGTVMALTEFPGRFRVVLLGDLDEVEDELARLKARDLPIELVHAPERVEMDEPPATVFRRKPNSSLAMATQMQKDGKLDGFFSAGSTGAIVAVSLLGLGRLEKVSRPAIATIFPNRGRGCVVLDVGATADCKPQHLAQFASMGSCYAHDVLGLATPRVGLLSIGEEATKGNELTQETHGILAQQSHLNFIGNVEGREVYSGVADVIVCDGFTGNVVLKTSEGLVDAVETLLGDELRGTFSSQVGYLLSRRAFRRFRRRVDYSEYGGAPLLGVAGLAIVGHGRSSPKAVRNAIAMAYRFAAGDFIQRVEHEIAAASVSPH